MIKATKPCRATLVFCIKDHEGVKTEAKKDYQKSLDLDFSEVPI